MKPITFTCSAVGRNKITYTCRAGGGSEMKTVMKNKTITEINYKKKIKISTPKQSDRNEIKSIHRAERK